MNDILNDLQLECLFRASPEFSKSNKLTTYDSVAHALSAYMKRKNYKSSRECFTKVTNNICKYLGYIKMGAPKINITARLDHAKSLCKRLDFKRFISQELGMDVLRPEDLSEDDCFIMILEYVGAASSSQLDQLSLVTCEFIQMLRKYERGI